MEYIDILLEMDLLKQLKKDKLDNKLMESYLFYSPDSFTNKKFTECFALMLFCDNEQCKSCPTCKKILEGVHPDVINFPETKSLAVADSQKIVEQATKKPMLLDKKIIVINDIDNSSQEAQNKLLKIIETPPNNVYFLATCTNLNAVLPTIKSRMQKYLLPAVGQNKIREILDDYKNEQNFELAINNGNGYLGQSLNILQNKEYYEDFKLACDFVFNIKKSSEVIDYTSKIKLNKDSANLVLDMMSNIFQDILYCLVNTKSLINNINIISLLDNIKSEFSIKSIMEIQKHILLAKKKIVANVNVGMIIEMLLIKILEVKYICK